MIWNPFKKIRELEKKIKELEAKELSPLTYVEKIINNLDWFDYRKLDRQHWSDYYGEAQQIVKSQVFNNELKKYVQDIVIDIANNSGDHSETMNKRTGMVFLESFKERLENIEDPREVERTENLYDPI